MVSHFSLYVNMFLIGFSTGKFLHEQRRVQGLMRTNQYIDAKIRTKNRQKIWTMLKQFTDDVSFHSSSHRFH